MQTFGGVSALAFASTCVFIRAACQLFDESMAPEGITSVGARSHILAASSWVSLSESITFSVRWRKINLCEAWWRFEFETRRAPPRRRLLVIQDGFRVWKLLIIQQSESEGCKGNKSRWNPAFFSSTLACGSGPPPSASLRLPLGAGHEKGQEMKKGQAYQEVSLLSLQSCQYGDKWLFNILHRVLKWWGGGWGWCKSYNCCGVLERDGRSRGGKDEEEDGSGDTRKRKYLADNVGNAVYTTAAL